MSHPKPGVGRIEFLISYRKSRDWPYAEDVGRGHLLDLVTGGQIGVEIPNDGGLYPGKIEDWRIVEIERRPG